MELITKEDCTELLNSFDQLAVNIEQMISNNKPFINNERYLSGSDVCKLLHVTKRTLQEYRDMRQIPYILICGKTLYKESDLQKILKNNYVSQLLSI